MWYSMSAVRLGYNDRYNVIFIKSFPILSIVFLNYINETVIIYIIYNLSSNYFRFIGLDWTDSARVIMHFNGTCFEFVYFVAHKHSSY